MHAVVCACLASDEDFFDSYDSEKYKVVDGVVFDAAGTTLLVYPPSRKGERYEVPEGVRQIAPDAFAFSDALTAIHLPSSVLSIGTGAFRNMPRLVKIEFPRTLQALPPEVCKDCPCLKTVAFPPFLATIGRAAFEGCTAADTRRHRRPRRPSRRTPILLAPTAQFS